MINCFGFGPIYMKKQISVVIPAYNESPNIPKLISQITEIINAEKKYFFEVIIVENASTDNSFSLLSQARKNDKRIKIIQLAKNAGCDGAIMAGLSFAKGEAAIVLMADLQENPKLISSFLRKWEEGYDMVYGIVKKRSGVNPFKKIGTFLFYKALYYLTGKTIPDNVSDFRLMDERVYKVILSMPERNKFFRGIAAWTGFKQIGIPFKREARFKGKSKADLKTVLTITLNGLTSFSYAPLRLPWLLAGLFFAAGIIFVLFDKQFSLLFFLLFLFALVMAIQSEYLIQVLEDVRARPDFIIKNTLGLKDSL